jgi:uncharacterized protein YaiL (DUF2058 family)
MSDSLKDQLLGLGFKPAAKTESRSAPTRTGSKARQAGNHKQPRQAPKTAKSARDIDLAKAFALRSEQERQERERAGIEKREASERKRLAKETVATLLQGQILNAADADIARHFSYGGKIKRIHVTAGQLPLLNAGKLGIVQFDGRYCLVTRDVLLAVREALPALVALYCDGNEEALPEGYDDPRFQVPDDLLW